MPIPDFSSQLQDPTEGYTSPSSLASISQLVRAPSAESQGPTMAPTVMSQDQGLLARISQALSGTNVWDQIRGPLAVGLAGLARDPNLQPQLMAQLAKQRERQMMMEAGSKADAAFAEVEGLLAKRDYSGARTALNKIDTRALPPELQLEVRKAGMKITEQEATATRQSQVATSLRAAAKDDPSLSVAAEFVERGEKLGDAMKAARELTLTHSDVKAVNGILVGLNRRTQRYENMPGEVGGKRFVAPGSVEALPGGGFGEQVPYKPETISQTFGDKFAVALAAKGVRNLSAFETQLRSGDPQAQRILMETATEFQATGAPKLTSKATRDQIGAFGYDANKVEAWLRSDDPVQWEAASDLVQKAHIAVDARKQNLMVAEANAKAAAEYEIRQSRDLRELYGPAASDIFNAETLKQVNTTKTLGQSKKDGDLHLSPDNAKVVRGSEQALVQVREIERLGKKLFTSNDPLVVAFRSQKYALESFLATNEDARLLATSQALMFGFAKAFGNDSRISDPDQKFAADTSGLTFLQSEATFNRTMARLKRIFTNTQRMAAGLNPVAEDAFEGTGPRPIGVIIRPGGKR